MIVIALAFISFIQADGIETPYVWVPPRIITGEIYEGMIVLDAASKSGQIVVLSTSEPLVAQIPESVFIAPHSNHGIFQITPLREGTSQIFALVNGKMISTNISVHSSSRQPERLLIVLPTNTTKTEEITGYVISTDMNGTPAPVTEDVSVTLSATDMIDLEQTKIRIPTGEYSAKFYAAVGGSGKIYATAKNLVIAEQQITKIYDDVTVKIAVAPNIVLENSKAFFFVWLEKDGRPYKIPQVTYAFVSSSNLKSVRFNENPQIKHHGDALLKVPLVEGVGKGHLISQEVGTSVVTASVEGFGSGKTDVFVGPVVAGQNFIKSEGGKQIQRTPNVAMSWFYPSVTDSVSYGVIALYHINSNGTSITDTVSRITPVPIDGRSVTLSSSGVNHPNILTLLESNPGGIGSSHAVQFEVSGMSHGNHTIFVSGPGLERYNSTLIVSPPFRDAYRIKITQIPAVLETSGNLAMISIVDNSGSLVNAKKVVGAERFTLISDNKHVEFSIPAQNTAIYSGVLEENSKLTVTANGFAPSETILRPSGAVVSVTLDVPPSVHRSESFPYAMHEVDSNGVPIRKLDSASTSTTQGVAIRDGRMIIDTTGIESIGIVTKIGASSKNVESFANTFRVDIVPNGTTNRVEKQFRLDLVGDVDDFMTLVDSPFPYEKINEKSILVTPDRVGSYNITVIAIKDGYAPARAAMSLNVEKFINITIRAVANDSTELNIEQQIRLGNTTRSIITPFHEEVRPQFFHASFPHDVLVGNRGYRLNDIVFADQSIDENKIENIFLGIDTMIIANYDRTVRIQAENAEGAGFYTYGEQVTLSVPPKDKIGFLVRDVFDHWEGIEYNSDKVTFFATNDIKAVAVLREDHTFLMLFIAIAITAILYVNFVRRKGLDVKFYLGRHNLRNLLRNIKWKRVLTS